VVTIFLIVAYFFVLDIEYVKVLPPILPILLLVALFTLLERKILAGIQRRRGPNIVGLWGLLQPIADAFKLILKETIIPGLSNLILFILAPIMTFTISLLS
jgi:NADH:ubiquinone oxidoreductase subunit H